MESALEEVAQDAIASAVARAAEYASLQDIIPEKKLESFSLRRSRYTYANRQMYRVYDRPDHFVLIEAASAHEAYAKSGIANALKIQRESFFTQVAIAKDRLQEDAERVDLTTELPSGNAEKRFLDLQTIDAELKAKEKPFEAFLISDIARQNLAPPPAAPMPEQDAAVQAEAPVAPLEVSAPAEPELASSLPVADESAPLDAAIVDVFAAEPKDEMNQAAAQEAEVPDEDRELTAEEVNALLMSGDEDL